MYVHIEVAVARLERVLAHLFGWHSIACHGHVPCGPPKGCVAKIGAGPLAWHRWVGRTTTDQDAIQGSAAALMTFDEVRTLFGRVCSHRNPRNRGMSCSLPPEHVDEGTDHQMGDDGGRWPL